MPNFKTLTKSHTTNEGCSRQSSDRGVNDRKKHHQPPLSHTDNSHWRTYIQSQSTIHPIHRPTSTTRRCKHPVSSPHRREPSLVVNHYPPLPLPPWYLVFSIEEKMRPGLVEGDRMLDWRSLCLVLQGFWGAMFARISVSFLLVCLSYFCSVGSLSLFVLIGMMSGILLII